MNVTSKMLRRSAISAAIGCAAAIPLVAGPAGAAVSAQPLFGPRWSVLQQTTLPSGVAVLQESHASTTTGGVAFTLADPSSTPSAYTNYVEHKAAESLSTTGTVSAVITVTATPQAEFVGNPDGGTSAKSFVRLFFESTLPHPGSGPTCAGSGLNASDYWWSNTSTPATTSTSGSYYDFTAGGSNGTVTLMASLTPASWSNLCGHKGTSTPAAFKEALANVKEFGLSFGSGSFFANGVGATGTAELVLHSYTT